MGGITTAPNNLNCRLVKYCSLASNIFASTNTLPETNIFRTWK